MKNKDLYMEKLLMYKDKEFIYEVDFVVESMEVPKARLPGILSNPIIKWKYYSRTESIYALANSVIF